MFCANCGNKLSKNDTACKQCENSVERMKMEEYLNTVDIKGKEEASVYLKNLKILFWSVILIYGFQEAIKENVTANAMLLTYFTFLVLLVYFVYYCLKVLKKERLGRIWAIWCVLLAPLSWLFLYPKITKPLKIILGEKELPLRTSMNKK